MVTYSPVSHDDLEDLVAIRISAMRESLELLGRFDPERARTRLLNSFVPELTQSIDFDSRRIGFFALRPNADGFYLDHLYIVPAWQGQGIGKVVIEHIVGLVGNQSVRLGALKGSRSNQFYQRYGFRVEREDELDIYYVYP